MMTIIFLPFHTLFRQKKKNLSYVKENRSGWMMVVNSTSTMADSYPKRKNQKIKGKRIAFHKNESEEEEKAREREKERRARTESNSGGFFL